MCISLSVCASLCVNICVYVCVWEEGFTTEYDRTMEAVWEGHLPHNEAAH